MKHRSKPCIPLDEIKIEQGEKLAELLRLHRWDFIIAGDGSATTWDNTAGFGSVLYAREAKTQLKFFGGLSHGTNNIAEMMAVVEPLLYLDGTSTFPDQKPTVYVISDSDYVVKTGNGIYRKKSNQALWAVIEHCQTKMNLIFRHVNRMLLPANIFGDQIGTMIRLYMDDTSKQLNQSTKENNHG